MPLHIVYFCMLLCGWGWGGGEGVHDSSVLKVVERGDLLENSSPSRRAALPPCCGDNCPTPQLIDVIAGLPESHKAELVPFLRAKPVRTASGIAVVVRALASPPDSRLPRDEHVACHGRIG